MRSTTNPSDEAPPESNHADAPPSPQTPWFHTYKPAASAKWHLLLAAAMWNAVGAFLANLGIRWLTEADAALTWPAVAIVVGAIKARFVLRRSARRIIDRIRERGDGRCLGGFLSPKSWLLVLIMMTAGRWLRSGPLPLVASDALSIVVGI